MSACQLLSSLVRVSQLHVKRGPRRIKSLKDIDQISEKEKAAILNYQGRKLIALAANAIVYDSIGCKRAIHRILNGMRYVRLD